MMFYICSMTDLQIVWFKRDLRVHDHAPLLAAVASGAPVLPVYIFEPGFWSQTEHCRRQFDFLMESLQSLDEALKARGSALCLRVGIAAEVFADLHKRHGLAAIHAHEETGSQWTYDRDRALQRWALKAGVAFREQAQNGVVRRHNDPEAWKRHWDAFMSLPRPKAPERLSGSNVPAGEWPIAEDFGLTQYPCPGRQPGGRAEGVELLRSFLAARGRRYRTDMSSPEAATGACSRLSPHFAFGTVSIREACQGAMRARADLQLDGDTTFAASLDAFILRLKWHSHDMQKLENQTSLSGRNLLAEPDVRRDVVTDGDLRLEAWISGRTGFPFLDACMRSLNQTGWLNHRARAMVMAFASQHLWMDWRHPAARLAALFTDFEPGIHYPQAQTQSGASKSGIPQIYNPVKQSLDHDCDGTFIRRWVPELATLPTAHIHAPWDAPKAALTNAGIVLGQTYPMRIVDHIAAAREARDRIYSGKASLGRARDAMGATTPARHANPVGKHKSAVPSLSPRQLAFDLQMPDRASSGHASSA